MTAICERDATITDVREIPSESVDLITPAEYARLRRLSLKTIYKHLDAGLIPGAYREGPKLWRIPVARWSMVAPVE